MKSRNEVIKHENINNKTRTKNCNYHLEGKSLEDKSSKKFDKTNKFQWTLNNIRMKKIISAPIWVTSQIWSPPLIFLFFFFFLGGGDLPLLDVRNERLQTIIVCSFNKT